MIGGPAIRFIDTEVFHVLLKATTGNTSNTAGYTTVRKVDYDNDGMLTEEELADVGIQPNTIRLSIGTEHIDDILFDLKEALDQI